MERQKGALPGNSNVTLFAGLNLGRADSVGWGVLLAEFLLVSRFLGQKRRFGTVTRADGDMAKALVSGATFRGFDSPRYLSRLTC